MLLEKSGNGASFFLLILWVFFFRCYLKIRKWYVLCVDFMGLFLFLFFGAGELYFGSWGEDLLIEGGFSALGSLQGPRWN